MHEGDYYTYIVASRSRTLYTGVTGNLHKRVSSINANGTKGFPRCINATGLSGTKDTFTSITP